MAITEKHRALRRAQYKFDFDTAPLCEHQLYAHASNDEMLQRLSRWRLIRLFEEFYKFPYFHPLREEWTIRRLKDVQGDYYWRHAAIRFRARSPAIPFFGLVASQKCRGVPFAYAAVLVDSGVKVAPRYFYNGEECLAAFPAEVAPEFDELVRASTGIIRPTAQLPL